MEFQLRGQRYALKAYTERRLGFALAVIAEHVNGLQTERGRIGSCY